MKINWSAISVIIMAVTWGVSVEVRMAKQTEAMDLSNRVKTLEELAFPMLVDWKANQKIKQWQEENIEKIRQDLLRSNPSVPAPKLVPATLPVPPSVSRSAYKAAETWAGTLFQPP